MSLETKPRETSQPEPENEKGLRGWLKARRAKRSAQSEASGAKLAHPGYGNIPPEILEKRQRQAEESARREAARREHLAEIDRKRADTGETPSVRSNERNEL